MTEYICKQDAVDAIHEFPMFMECNEIYIYQKRIEKIPAADVASVRHGRWIKYTGMGKVQWMCSECSAEEKNPKVANYCYHCGAKMDA